MRARSLRSVPSLPYIQNSLHSSQKVLTQPWKLKNNLLSLVMRRSVSGGAMTRFSSKDTIFCTNPNYRFPARMVVHITGSSDISGVNMDFDSPDVMKDFPGLYASELNKQCNNDSDYSDENEKVMKKDILIGKRKEKKDKDKGYAALEGESSADENFKSRSPSKTKKAKSFKFSTKTKEKRDKSREKEKDVEKKKDRDKKNDKKVDKEKMKSEKTKKLKQSVDETSDIGESGAKLPDRPEDIDNELKKQESLLAQIHKEGNVGCISKHREELLWEVQRIITQLKRKLKTANKDKEAVAERVESQAEEEEIKRSDPEVVEKSQDVAESSDAQKQNLSIVPESLHEGIDIDRPSDIEDSSNVAPEQSALDNTLTLLQLKNDGLHLLRDSLLKDIKAEHNQIMMLKSQLTTEAPTVAMVPHENLNEVMDLFLKENQILQIKKINLVRQIIEEQEMCIELKAQIMSKS
ncbi:hypothetical protein GEV33_002250 [Tenebrio molitor]|uniref:RalA-binding protein 1-like Ral binding domain-containing protein n=1 Tax=Tenebrio molitor TaxID=7067 RepID=A0A8J6HUI6_TENMO|nr:hypothetical protein GEV33_002250 [Tenebrio molitor]